MKQLDNIRIKKLGLVFRLNFILKTHKKIRKINSN
jgi:hypothetical protein